MVTETERIAILLEMKNEQFKRDARTAGNEIKRLERRLDPLAAAEERMHNKQRKFNAALKAGTLDAQQHANAMGLVQREYDQFVSRSTSARNSVVATNASLRANSSFLNRHKEAFRQGGYQVGDFAVQVQGGTSALTAFTQQGSQFLGIFGPMGAVMGAVLAVGAPLAGVLWSLGDATDDTKAKARTFSERVAEADSALAAMAASADYASEGGLENLRKKYGDLTAEVKEMAEALFEIDKRAALNEVGGVIGEVTKQVAAAVQATAGVVSSALAVSGTEAAREEAMAYRAEIEAIQADIDNRKQGGFIVDQAELNNLAVMREELAALEGNMAAIGSLASGVDIDPKLLSDISAAQSGLEAARDAGDFSEMAQRLGEIRGLLQESGEIINQDVIDGITRAEALAREQALRLEEGENAANGIASADMAGSIGGAASEAQELARWLGVSLSRALAISQTTPAMADEDLAMSQSVIPDAAQRQRNRQAVENFNRLTAPKKVGSGGSRGQKARSSRSQGKAPKPLFSISDGEVQKIERQLELLGKSKSQIAALSTKHKLLDEAKKRGMTISDGLGKKIEAEAAQVGQLAEKYQEARDKIAAMEEIQSSFEDSIVNAAMGGADAMDQFKNSIKRAALEYALFGRGLFAGGSQKSGGGLLGGLVSSIFGGFRANGGPVSSDKGYIVGERGPEWFQPRSSGTIVSNDKMTSGGGGGESVVQIVLGEGLEGAILQKAQGNAIQLVAAAGQSQQRALGSSMQTLNKRGTT